MTLTKRDKNLLFGLGMVLVIVVFGNFIILPQWSKKDELSVELKDKQKQKEKMEQVINSYSANEAKLSEIKQTYLTRTQDYYDIEKSHEMERQITKIIIKAGLKSKDFTINEEPALASLAPYIHSELAKSMGGGSTATTATAGNEASTGSTTAATTAATTATEQGTQGEGQTDATVSQSVVYAYNINVTAQGSQSNMKKLIETIYADYPAIQIKSYNMNAQTGITASNEVVSAGDLSLNLEVYMCDK